jgi:hypothetical protein
MCKATSAADGQTGGACYNGVVRVGLFSRNRLTFFFSGFDRMATRKGIDA